MKIELIEEIKINEDPWYCIRIDGQYVKGTSKKELAEEYYEKVLNDVNALNTKKKVLKSAEIDVSLKF
jgi:hypothetical protein